MPAQLTFQYGSLAPSPLMDGAQGIMHASAAPIMGPLSPQFGVPLAQPQLPTFPAWQFNGSLPGAPPSLCQCWSM